MSLWIDGTLGKICKIVQSGVVQELAYIDFSNDVSVGNTIPSSLTKLLGYVGHASVCADAGCVSAGFGKPITNMSLCAGPLLEISVNDITTATLTAEAKLTYIAWGW